jgi:hypothetical protein
MYTSLNENIYTFLFNKAESQIDLNITHEKLCIAYVTHINVKTMKHDSYITAHAIDIKYLFGTKR